MSRRGKRLFSVLLICALCVGLLPHTAYAAEQTVQNETLEYYSIVSDAMVRDTCRYTDDWFRETAGTRNDGLALISAQLAAASADAACSSALLRKLGFDDVTAARYDSEDPGDCGYVAGIKTISVDGRDTRLAAVAVQSSRYGDKGWQQNVTVDLGGITAVDHAAYAAAARTILSDLERLSLKDGDLVWITGLSRGGAVANLLGAYLLNEASAPTVFGYTFESPAVTLSGTAHDEKYEGIRNYISDDDPVTMLPIWGMTRYGREIVFNTVPAADLKKALADQNPDAARLAEEYRPAVLGGSAKTFAEKLLGKLAAAVPERADYTRERTAEIPEAGPIRYSLQDGLQALCHLIFGGGEDPKTILSAMQDNLPDLLYAYVEEIWAAKQGPDDRAALLADAAQRRWHAAGLLDERNLSLETPAPVRRSDLYALLLLLSPIAADVRSVAEEGWTLPDAAAFRESLYESYIDYSVLAGLELGAGTLVFSHYPEVVIARLKLLAALPAQGNPTVQEPERPAFADVSADAWYAEAVSWAAGSGLVQGTGENLFSPDMLCTRVELVTFLWRAAGKPEAAETAQPFADVPSGSWFEQAVCWAASQGISKGVDALHFAPDAVISRGECVTLLYRMMGGTPADRNDPFADVRADAYCHDAVLWAAERGIAQGVSPTAFAPGDGCSRAMIVTFLYRALGQEQ